jgi:pimeloyl-ACP methyl ester carboxylesterase
MTALQNSARTGGYIDVGRLHTYYEVHGAGEPVVLLHGGLCTVETLDAMTAAFAQQYKVYLPERRGHGRTPDVDGPLTYQNMAADTVAFLDALGLRAAHLVGFSDGGNVALQVALDRPDLVGKLVVLGAAAREDGYAPEQIEVIQRWLGQPSPPIMAGFKQLYGAVSPDGPEHFEVMFAKAGQLWQSDWSLSWEDLGRLSAPTLMLLADDDVVTVEHAAAVVRAIPDAQLGVVPGTSHALPFEKPDLVNRLVLEFLATEQVPRMMSLRALRAEEG